jgi:hypothetical protein
MKTREKQSMSEKTRDKNNKKYNKLYILCEV